MDCALAHVCMADSIADSLGTTPERVETATRLGKIALLAYIVWRVWS